MKNSGWKIIVPFFFKKLHFLRDMFGSPNPRKSLSQKKNTCLSKKLWRPKAERGEYLKIYILGRNQKKYLEELHSLMYFCQHRAHPGTSQSQTWRKTFNILTNKKSEFEKMMEKHIFPPFPSKSLLPSTLSTKNHPPMAWKM